MITQQTIQEELNLIHEQLKREIMNMPAQRDGEVWQLYLEQVLYLSGKTIHLHSLLKFYDKYPTP